MQKVTNLDTKACPIRNVLDRVGDKWSLLVLSTLEDETMRFMDIRRAIEDISQRMLTQTLRNLERDGYVERTVYAEIPPRVEYSLTAMGCSFLAQMKPVFAWASQWNEVINGAREKYLELSAEKTS